MSAMQRLFQLMAEKKASDIFISAGAPINIKINGTAVPINQQVMTPEIINNLLHEVLSDSQFREFEEALELNGNYSLEGVGNFRLSAFRQKGTPALVVRYVPAEIPALETLNVPGVLAEIIMEKHGLILMVGATGAGKTTTLTSMLDYRNERKSGHILTLEDPIEFVFRNKRSIVNQRELGSDTRDYQLALKNALRQAPDCIFIGEVRDKETMAQAIAYAQSGHLCLATLHANNSYHALSRIIGLYPLENRPALLADLAVTLKAIISQRLVKKPDGSRIPAVEVMLNSRHISELIEKGDMDGMRESMDSGMTPGAQTFEQALFKLYKSGAITLDAATAAADSANNLLFLINNDQSGPLQADASSSPATVADNPLSVPSASFSEFNLKMD
ncbi:Pilus retraction protein PilT [Sterolibacterium denitrificans]|uniref:Pilus retraction protein PilT n=1 Tax=Sterolibacterium denitrificans TaxID=157592 RepID=A0A7Z7MVF8_9PROT|nr:PilT/PilU family type 4a pilus ATPase [Sterolibacterium denitrificans]SMB27519.1 Pilus retraction protein PilT [Sterolibacterium denitrificans]